VARRKSEREEGLYLLLLKDASEVLGKSPTLAAALDATVELVAKRLGFDVCSIYLQDDDGDLVLRATHGLNKQALGQVRMAPGEGLTGSVFKTERNLFTSHAEAHPQFKFFPETGEEGFRSFGGIPLVQRDACIGVLTVQTEREHRFPANAAVALETLAGQVVSLIGVRGRLGRPVEASTEMPAWGRTAGDMLVGLGTSPGVGLGPALVLEFDPLMAAPPLRDFTDEETELSRFEDARSRAVAAAGARASDLERDRDAAVGAIFRAHKEILLDGEIDRRVRELITQAYTVELAVYEAFESCAQVLSSLPGARQRENAKDYLDARTHLLQALGIQAQSAANAEGVVIARFLTPAQTANLDPSRVTAIVTEHGSETSHASLVARSMGIPAVVGVPSLMAQVRPGGRLLVDGDNGFVFLAPHASLESEYVQRTAAARVASERIEAEYEARRAAGPLILDVEILANVGLPGELEAAVTRGASGIGLFRTEFYFLVQTDWPGVDQQEAYYREVFRGAPPGPIVVRLLDAGGDKVLPYMHPAPEPNPILGFRSVRLLLANSDLADAQITAILRAAAEEDADVRILVPLITVPWELDAIRSMIAGAAARDGVPERPLGMMVETPGVLFQLEALLRRVDFVSVGTNDLTQYLLAVDRDDELVRQYYSSLQPAVLRALAFLQDGLRGSGLSASVCGEMASTPLGALALLALGYRTLSVRPRAIQALRCLVHCVPQGSLAALYELLLAAESPADAERALRHTLRRHAPFLLGL
jgi:phosphotransferase system, enzyme I, PtsP